ncbi:MAG: hypothetical protein HQL30_03740 [Candidatus Omnitrophica bacterium]|nr:hypothetical protein [Candidatus Omnitrophota bacterium]
MKGMVWVVIFSGFMLFVLAGEAKDIHHGEKFAGLPAVSGLAWVFGDTFLAVHDAKFPNDKKGVRVSLIRLPEGTGGILFTPLEVDFPEEKSSDLESVARVPGTDLYLLCESSFFPGKKPFAGRIFLAKPVGKKVKILKTVKWPEPIENVEGTAVARSGDKYIFIYAERADGKGFSEIRYSEFDPHELKFGEFKPAGIFTCPWPNGVYSRAVSELGIDPEGFIYAASTEDTGDDNGPFRGAVYRIGKVDARGPAGPVALFKGPERIAALDGVKVEGIAARGASGNDTEIFIASDDENYGGIIRKISQIVSR